MDNKPTPQFIPMQPGKVFAPVLDRLDVAQKNLESWQISTQKQCQFDGKPFFRYGGSKVADALIVYKHQCNGNPGHTYWLP